MLWLAEHHFDGGCAYVDPLTFAAAIAVRTSRITIGFAVAQMALHHPIRLAEQVALIDRALCRQTFGQRFTIERMVRGYLNVYEQLTEARGALPTLNGHGTPHIIPALAAQTVMS